MLVWKFLSLYMFFESSLLLTSHEFYANLMIYQLELYYYSKTQKLLTTNHNKNDHSNY